MPGQRIGYIRVSSIDQNPQRQLEQIPPRPGLYRRGLREGREASGAGAPGCLRPQIRYRHRS